MDLGNKGIVRGNKICRGKRYELIKCIYHVLRHTKKHEPSKTKMLRQKMKMIYLICPLSPNEIFFYLFTK